MKETTDKRFNIQDSHLTLEVMIAYIEGKLDEHEIALAERIIHENPLYAAAIDSLRNTLSEDPSLKDRVSQIETAYTQHIQAKARSLKASDESESPKRGSGGWERGWGWKLAAAILLLISIFLGVSRFTHSVDDTALAQQYLTHYEDPIGVMAQLENQAFALYHQHKYAEAIPLFEKLLQEADSLQLNKLHMFLGVCLVQTLQPEKAQVHFHEIIRHDDSIYVAAAKWYMALSFLQQGNNTNAKDMLQDLNAQPATGKQSKHYQQQAEELLMKLSSSS